MKILIGGAWPYANGNLHIGHLSSLLAGDVLARYHRLYGDTVCYVSGSDCHGTPITLRAKQEGVQPKEIADRFHASFVQDFKHLGFSYDVYSRTTAPSHIRFVQEAVQQLHDCGKLDSRTVEQAWCPSCNQFLPDRFVNGRCPSCGEKARGDQCDACGTLLDPVQLHDRTCGLCGTEPEFRASEHLYLAVKALSHSLNAYVSHAEGWRANAVGLTRRYLKEGLCDRAVTRDIDWGIPTPIPGFEDKKIYVWVEAVLGYLSASREWAARSGQDISALWDPHASDICHYYVHGKDNIPFHTVILPALLLCLEGYRLPDRIVSSEYETLEGRKISTSGNWALWAKDLLERYDPDTIRWFFIANGPEKRDADFSFQEFILTHNSDVLGGFGNLVNRTLTFLEKNFEGRVPEGTLPCDVALLLERAFRETGKRIRAGQLRDALDTAFEVVRFGNKFFDTEKPWITVREAPAECANTLFVCVQILSTLSVLLAPFIPFGCERLQVALGCPVGTGVPEQGFLTETGTEDGTSQDETRSAGFSEGTVDKNVWTPPHILPGSPLLPCGLLYTRIAREAAEEERNRLSLLEPAS